MLTARIVATVCAVVLATAPAHAERIVALAPLATFGTEDTSGPIKQLTAQLEGVISKLPDTKLVTAAQVAEAIKRAKKPQLRACEGETACLVELGRLVGANVLLTGEIGGLGDAKVVYLAATDVTAGRELRSTTLAVGKSTGGGAAGAVIRLLDPEKYRGTVRFAIDVQGATVYVNGSRTSLAGKGEVTLPVGTQAVRVTHPQYRDFVRFIDVTYGQTTDVPVQMQQYPIISRDVQGRPINSDQTRYREPVWYRRWYVVAGGAVGVAIIGGIVAGAIAASQLPDAPCRKVGGMDC